jgi:hypothetical protein
MRLMAVAVVAALAASAVSVAEAQQQPRQRRVAEPPGTYVMHRDESGRTRTKVLVQKRSYLDGGTEVMPGDNVDSFRQSFMRGQPSSITQNTAFDRPGPLSDPYFLPGKLSPYPWFGN